MNANFIFCKRSNHTLNMCFISQVFLGMEFQDILFFHTSLFLISWLGLNLLEILITLHGIGDDRLHVQIDVFHEENHRDKELMSSTQSDFLDLDSHTDVFHKLYHNLANTPQASVLLNILRVNASFGSQRSSLVSSENISKFERDTKIGRFFNCNYKVDVVA